MPNALLYNKYNKSKKYWLKNILLPKLVDNRKMKRNADQD